jgi:hypothetical protein
LKVLGLDPNGQAANSARWRRVEVVLGASILAFWDGSGRRVADIDDTVRELIYEGTMTQLHRYLREIKFASFRVAAIEKVISGVTTVEEVLRVLPRSSLDSKSFARVYPLGEQQRWDNNLRASTNC